MISKNTLKTFSQVMVMLIYCNQSNTSNIVLLLTQKVEVSFLLFTSSFFIKYFFCNNFFQKC